MRNMTAMAPPVNLGFTGYSIRIWSPGKAQVPFLIYNRVMNPLMILDIIV